MIDINNRLRIKPIIPALVMPIIMLLVVFSMVTPVFETNDDVGIAMRSQGIGTMAQASEFLIFSHIYLGSALLWLTKIAGTLSYGIHVYFAIILAAVLLNYSILRIDSDKPSIILVGFINIMSLTPILARPQFTIVAGLLTAAAVLLILSVWLQRPDKRIHLFAMIFLAAFVLLYGFMVRYKSAVMILLISAPIFLFAKPPTLSFILKKLAPTSFILMLILFGLHWIDRQAYTNDPKWQDFNTTQPLRLHFMDNRNVKYSPATKHIFDDTGWTENDFLMIKSWFFLDQATYAPGKLAFIADHFPVWKHASSRLSSVHDIFSMWFGNRTLLLLFIALLLVMLYLSGAARLTLGSAFIAMLIMFLAVHLLGRVPLYRIYAPGLIFLLFLAALLFCKDLSAAAPDKTMRSQPWLVVTLIGLTVLAASQVYQVQRSGKWNTIWTQFVSNDINALQPKTNQLFVAWGADFPYIYAYTPFAKNPPLARIKLYSLGVTSLSPYSIQRLAEFNIDNLYHALYLQKNVFLITNQDNIAMLIQFIKQHYGINLKKIHVYTGKSFTVYQLETV